MSCIPPPGNFLDRQFFQAELPVKMHCLSHKSRILAYSNVWKGSIPKDIASSLATIFSTAFVSP